MSDSDYRKLNDAIDTLRAALAEPVKAEMTRRDIIRLAKEADDLTDAELGSEWNPDRENLRDIHFAALVAAEKEQQMIRDGWRQCAEGQRTTQYCGLLDAAVKAEREACARMVDHILKEGGGTYGKAIRARGEA